MSNQPPEASNVYQYSFSDLVGARQRAFLQLGESSGDMSDQVDIATNDTNMVRIMVTYLDPELIQYIMLNHSLNDPDRVITPLGIDGFNDELKNSLHRLADRNEILFLVTVTSPFYRAQAYNSNVLTVKLPISEMILVNGSGRRTPPTHADYVLGVNIDITHGPVSGIVGYPTAVIDQGQCAWIIDQWTTSLTLDIPWVELGKTRFDHQFWNIPYRALVMRDDNNPVPTFDPAFITPVSKLDSPPTPSWTPNAQVDNTNWTIYWEEMGRYIWNYVIIESRR